MEYMSCPEAAKKWGISERRVQILCSENRIPGVSKLGYMLSLIHIFAEIQKAQDKEQTTEQAQPAQEAAKQPETKAAAPERPEETAPVQEKEAQPEQAAPCLLYTSRCV